MAFVLFFFLENSVDYSRQIKTFVCFYISCFFVPKGFHLANRRVVWFPSKVRVGLQTRLRAWTVVAGRFSLYYHLSPYCISKVYYVIRTIIPGRVDGYNMFYPGSSDNKTSLPLKHLPSPPPCLPPPPPSPSVREVLLVGEHEDRPSHHMNIGCSLIHRQHKTRT